MDKLKKLGLSALALVGLSGIAGATTPTPGAFGGAVDFSAASTDVIYVGYAVLTFGLVLIGFWIVYRMMHSAKRA